MSNFVINRRASLMLGVALVALPVSGLFAQESDVEELVITASRRAQPLSEVGKSISVITEEALKLQQINFVVDALQTAPGVSINQNGTFGGVATVSIRGNATDQTVVLVDGVQVNDVSAPGGGFDFASLDPSGLERIEILRGPQAVLYGSDAIGGVVNIITKSGGDGFGGNLFAEVGSFSTYRLGGSVRGGDEDLAYSFSASTINTDGISAADSADGNLEDDGYENVTLRGRVSARLTDFFRAEVTSTYSDSTNEFDSFGPVDGDEVAESDEFIIAGRGFLDLLDGRLSNLFSVEYSEIDRENFSDGAFSFGATGNRLNLDYLATFDIDDDLSLSAGLQREITEAPEQDPEAISINSVFGLLSYAGIENLNISAGVRVDDHETFGSTTNAQVSGTYLFEETGTRIKANWGEGFKAPTIFQLTFFFGDFLPNPDLEPEQSEAFEVGVEQDIWGGQFKVGATYFDQETDDLIIFTFNAGFQNVDQASSRGVELFLEGNITEAITLAANYTFTDATDDTTGEALIRRPRNEAFGNIGWQITDALQTNLSVTYNGAETDFGGQIVDGWIRFDLRASYQLNETFELYGRIDNLFDEDYQQIAGFGTPGTSVFAGVRANF